VPIPRTDVNIQDIYFKDTLTGYVVTRKNTGDSAFIYKTTNSGDNWRTVLAEQIYLTSINFATDSVGYSVGSAPPGIVKKTTNAGENWFTVATMGAYPLIQAKFINKDTGWVASNDLFSSGIFKTTNGGLNWTSQFGNASEPRRMFFLNKDTGWVVTDDIQGKLFRTTNGGNNWNLQFMLSAQSGFGDIYFFNANTGVITSGTNLRTTNGGFNWMSTNETGTRLSFANDSIGWAGLTFNVIGKTTDGGKTWGRQNSTNFNNTNVFAINSLNVWTGAGSYPFHTTDGGGPITDITILSNEIPNNYFLNQNYPNPFNPSTKINYELKITNYVSLKVFDINGKEIQTLISKKQSAGIYSIEFNGSNLSSGIYFYTLKTDNFTDTKKMMLLK
jgi:photosystem II stability/assembly factor-like uncharacterized protein